MLYFLFRDLYQKVIHLEQNNHQQEIKISKLGSQIEQLEKEKEAICYRYVNGDFLWKIKEFSLYHQKLRSNHNFVIYSKGNNSVSMIDETCLTQFQTGFEPMRFLISFFSLNMSCCTFSDRCNISE